MIKVLLLFASQVKRRNKIGAVWIDFNSLHFLFSKLNVIYGKNLDLFIRYTNQNDLIKLDKVN